MSRRDGIGEVDGWCHECGRTLDEPYSGATDLCERCAEQGLDPDPDTIARARRFWATEREIEVDVFEPDELDEEDDQRLTPPPPPPR